MRRGRGRMGIGQNRALGGGRSRRPQPRGKIPGTSPLPWDSTAERNSGSLLRERNDAVTGGAADWQGQQEELGLGAGAGNPYSKMATLGNQRDIGNRAVRNSAGNQLYAGSTVNASRGVASAYDRGRQSIEAAFARGQAAYEQRKREAETGYESGLGELQEGALNRAIAQTPQAAPLGRRKRRQRGRGR
jgi:hypothetical protein